MDGVPLHPDPDEIGQRQGIPVRELDGQRTEGMIETVNGNGLGDDPHVGLDSRFGRVSDPRVDRAALQ
ncbi:hypothetical protein GCM10009557_03060 [Virgisporangium ochraceum]